MTTLRMNPINTRWLELATHGAVIEVSPGQTHLINTEPPPQENGQQTNPLAGGWGPQTPPISQGGASKHSSPFQKPGFDVTQREWRTTWLFVWTIGVPLPLGQGIIQFPPRRARADLVEFLLEVTPEVTQLVYDRIAKTLTATTKKTTKKKKAKSEKKTKKTKK